MGRKGVALIMWVLRDKNGVILEISLQELTVTCDAMILVVLALRVKEKRKKKTKGDTLVSKYKLAISTAKVS